MIYLIKFFWIINVNFYSMVSRSGIMAKIFTLIRLSSDLNYIWPSSMVDMNTFRSQTISFPSHYISSYHEIIFWAILKAGSQYQR